MTNTLPLGEWSPAARRLIVTAERLFAEHGLGGVSLRQIAHESGTANHSAVHYHFESKDGLVAAILAYRLPQIIRERRMLVRRWDGSDVHTRLEAHFLPIFELAEDPENRYVAFVEQLQRHEPTVRSFTDLPADLQASNEEFNRDLHVLLGDLEEPLRRLRIAQTVALCLHAAADRDIAVAAGSHTTELDLFVSSVLDGASGYLTAPPSAATRQRIGSVRERTTSPLRPI